MLSMLKEEGATLVEALAFTVIAIIFVISAVALWNMASNSANSQNAVRQIQALQTDIKDLFQNQDGYGDLNNELAVNAEIVPEDLNVPNPGTTPVQIFNGYGGDVTLTSADSGNAFTVEYAGVPQEACISIASTLAGDFYRLDLNGTQQVNEESGGSLPMTAANAQGACNAGGGNTLTYFSR